MMIKFYQFRCIQLVKMSVRKLIGMEQGVQDLQFQLRPLTFFLDKSNKSFVLYLQKGMQVLGRFSTTITSSSKLAYHFKSVESAIFRLNSHSNTSYMWSLYTSQKDKSQEVFEDAAHFDIADYIQLYQSEIGKKQKEIQSSYKDKNISKQMIYETWSKLKRQMKSHRSKVKTAFKSHKYNIQFQLVIKNSLDLAMQLYKQEQDKKSLKKNQSEVSLKQKVNSININSKIEANDSNYVKIEDIVHLSLTPKISENMNQLVERPKDQQDTSGQAIKRIIQNPNQEEEKDTNVKIMNPIGQQINQRQSPQQHSHKHHDHKIIPMPLPPYKKISLLSDIIERSCQGSSAYGKDISSQKNNTHNTFTNYNLPDHTIVSDSRAEQQGEQDILQVRQKLNKFMTLPDKQNRDINNALHIVDQFRRAKTSQKPQSEMPDKFHQQSIIVDSNVKEIQKDLKGSNIKTAGDPYAKWIIFICILVVILLVGSQMPGAFKSSKGKRKGIKI